MRFHRLKVLRRLPHPGRGFTQGLLTDGATVWESTGLYEQSSLRRYRLGAVQCETCASLPRDLFAEGICRAGAASVIATLLIAFMFMRQSRACRLSKDSISCTAMSIGGSCLGPAIG